MEDYTPDTGQRPTEPQGGNAETQDNLFTIPPLAERDPESLDDDSISGLMLYMYVCIGLGAFLNLLSLKEPGATPMLRYTVWINLAFAAYTVIAAYKRMRNAVFLAKSYVWASFATNVCLVLHGALVTPVGAGLNIYTAVGAVISAALLCFLYKGNSIEARFPRKLRRAFLWDWLAILVVFVIPSATLAIQSYNNTGEVIEQVEKKPDPKAIKTLKSEIAKLQKQCPTTIGLIDIVSVDYNADKNTATMRVSTAQPVKSTKTYRELAKENVILAYSYGALRNSTFVRTFSAARASLHITMTSYSTNQSITLKLTPEDFDSIVSTKLDEKELSARWIKVLAYMENEACPYSVDSQTTMLSEKVEGDMFVCVAKFDSSYVPESKDIWEALKTEYGKQLNKREVVESYLSDPITAKTSKAIVSADYGLRLIFTSENGKYTATVEISPKEFGELYESILEGK